MTHLIENALLNPAQRLAVTDNTRALLVLAGAGSGKTRVITYRMARLLEEATPGRAILALTFTNKAAKEMKSRLSKLVGRRACSDVSVATFHSFCARTLRAEAREADLPQDFTILDAREQSAQLALVMQDTFSDLDVNSRVIGSRISWWKNQGYREYNSIPYVQPWDIQAHEIYKAYTDRLATLKALDFDDLVLRTLGLFQNSQHARARFQNRFQHILVDEYQDTNPLQFQLLKTTLSNRQNICVVGDDDQAIYSFRGSAIENILSFDSIFTPCRVIKLQDNYRCSANVLNAANAVIAVNRQRREKTLSPTKEDGAPIEIVHAKNGADEAERVANAIEAGLRSHDVNPGDIAILYRAGPQSRLFEEALRYRGIPYHVVGGEDFFQKYHVKNVLAFMRLLIAPDHELAFRRVINLPSRGLGAKTIQTWIDYCRDHNLALTHLQDHDEIDLGENRDSILPLRKDALKSIHNFNRILGASRELVQSSEQVDSLRRNLAQFIHRICYEDFCSRVHHPKEREAILATLDETLTTFAARCEIRLRDAEEQKINAPSSMTLIRDFLDRLVLEEEEARVERDNQKRVEENKRKSKVTLMSLHASKGLEYPWVFLVGFEEGLLPHKKTLDEREGNDEEERRLAYVGITRAMERLWVTRAKFRRQRNKWIGREPSRFFHDIPKSCTRDLELEMQETVEAEDFFSSFLGANDER